MAQRRFDILFDGSVINGADVLQVKQKVQALFKLSDTDTERLFSGQPLAIKKNLDRQTAARYQAAMTKAGARIQLVLNQTDETQAATQSEQEKPPEGNHPQRLTLSPAGSDLLTADERSAIEPIHVDTSSLSIDSPVASFDEKPALESQIRSPETALNDASTQRYPNNDHIEIDTNFDVAAAGERLSQAPHPSESPILDLAHLSALDAGTALLSDEEKRSIQPQPEPKSFDNLDLDLADAGEDMLQAHEKKAVSTIDINTSAITLSD